MVPKHDTISYLWTVVPCLAKNFELSESQTLGFENTSNTARRGERGTIGYGMVSLSAKAPRLYDDTMIQQGRSLPQNVQKDYVV